MDLTQQDISNEVTLLCRACWFVLTSKENQGNFDLNGDLSRVNFEEMLMTLNRSLVLKKIKYFIQSCLKRHST